LYPPVGVTLTCHVSAQPGYARFDNGVNVKWNLGRGFEYFIQAATPGTTNTRSTPNVTRTSHGRLFIALRCALSFDCAI
jgi:hypothetical protein